MIDDFDRYWQWSNKPLESTRTIPADIHHAITSLPPEARRDRANEACAIYWRVSVIK